MRILAIALSVLFHLAIIVAMSAIPPQKSTASTKLVEMTVRKPEPPPLPPKIDEPPPKKEEPKPPPEVKPKLVKKKTVEKVVQDEPEPKKEEPKPPPRGFSIDMSSTVVGGNGVAVRAEKGRGNMFANPNDNEEAPKEKVTERPPDEGGKGRGTVPAGAYQVTKMPEFIGDERARIPPYPESAKQRGIEGVVMLKVFVGASGRVEDVRVLVKLDPECDAAALKSAREKFRFKPAMAGDEPVGMWIDVPVRFVIER